MMSFAAMEMKFGPTIAYYFLAEIEKAAHIPSSTTAEIDPETRLAKAIAAQDQLMQMDQALAA